MAWCAPSRGGWSWGEAGARPPPGGAGRRAGGVGPPGRVIVPGRRGGGGRLPPTSRPGPFGLGGEEEPRGGVELTVSRNFGAESLRTSGQKKIPAGETVMRLLQRKVDVKTRYGGGFVQEIDGISGGRRSGRPVDWFYYVNGIESENGAAARRLSPGDRVWWDHHDWGAAMRIPAVVGSYPEPFVSGSGGKRLPVRIDCGESAQRACDEVRQRLENAGAKVGGVSAIGSQDEGGVLRVLVGPWADVPRDPAARPLGGGPEAPGGVALPPPRGGRLRTVH